MNRQDQASLDQRLKQGEVPEALGPELDEADWKCIDREPHARDERHAHSFVIETWDRSD